MTQKCSCGFDLDDYQIERKNQYTKFGWFLNGGLGMSAKPVRVDFKCSDCGDIIKVITDKEELKKYIGR